MTDELDIETEVDALCALKQYRGSTILDEATARAIAEAFDVTLKEAPGWLEPISHLDRIQPDNDDLGIGVGSLTLRLTEELGLDAEERVAGGHGRTQRNYKDDNLPKLEAYITNRET